LKLENWALIAEVVPGIAVIITLIVLIIGVNENTKATYAANNLAVYSELHDIVLTTAGSDTLAALRYRFAAGGWEALDEEEAFRVRIIERSIFRIYETAFFAPIPTGRSALRSGKDT